MSKTVVGLFPSNVVAEDVRQQLITTGYSSGDVKIVANNHSEHYGAGDNAGIGEKVSHFFKSLTGGDDTAHNHYANGLNRGGALLAITVDNDNEADGAAARLRQHGAQQIEGDVDGDEYNDPSTSSYSAGSAGTTGYAGADALGTGAATDTTFATSRTGTDRDDFDRTGTNGTQSIPVVEENLVVGKREVDRGGVRVYSHVVETPVSTDVTLRDENILVERRPVDRVATAADFNPGERSFELRATGEEAVVGKTARVVEEVRVGKDSTERTEAVRDSVRRTEVEVENLPGTTNANETLTGTTAGTGTGRTGFGTNSPETTIRDRDTNY